MKILWGQKLGLPECPYARRWVLQFSFCSLRIHHFYRSDDDRAFHDHPWWFLTFILAGAYIDVSEDSQTMLKRGDFAFRRAEHKHTVRTDGVWTFLITGAEVRTWGFWTKAGKFLRARKFFWKHGHHPCDQP